MIGTSERAFSGLHSRSHCGDLHCNGNTELNEQMGCILGLLCCVKIKGLLYFLFFIVEQVLLLLEKCFCFTVQTCSIMHLIAAIVTFLRGRNISTAKLSGSWHLGYALGHW